MDITVNLWLLNSVHIPLQISKLQDSYPIVYAYFSRVGQRLPTFTQVPKNILFFTYIMKFLIFLLYDLIFTSYDWKDCFSWCLWKWCILITYDVLRRKDSERYIPTRIAAQNRHKSNRKAGHLFLLMGWCTLMKYSVNQ